MLRLGLLLAIFPIAVFSLESGDRCTTPNKESGTCTPIRSCSVILQAIVTQNKDAISFAQQSRCGNDNAGPLVCCGTRAYFTSATIVTTTDTTLRAGGTSDGSVLLPNRNSCGRGNVADRIVGGTVTEIGEFPWMALLRYDYTDGSDAGFRCGGTLINNRYVLTAAHCVKTSREGTVIKIARLGEWRLSTELDCVDDDFSVYCADPFIDVPIQETISHNLYSRVTKSNDIALIRLSRNITYTEYIMPICLPPENYDTPPAGTVMTATGWGFIENRTNSDVLLKVNLPLVNSTYCTTRLNLVKTPVSSNQVCAGAQSNKDTCQGDSGGPLMRAYADSNLYDKQWYQEGIVSFGRDCGQIGYPGVYTRVPRYISWIKSTIRN